MSDDRKRLCMILLFVFALAFAVRLGAMFVTPNQDDNPALDSHYYKILAHNLVAGSGYSLEDDRPSIFVAPLYPAFIAAFYLTTGENPMPIKVAQMLLGALTVLMVYYLGLLLFGHRVGLIAAIAAAIHPELAAISSILYTETLFTFLLVAGVILAVLAVRRSSLCFLSAAGVVLGLATLCRGILIPMPFFFLAALLLTRVKLRQAVLWTCVLGACMAVTVAPWMIRNYVVTKGEIVPVATGMGLNLFAGNYLPFDGRHNYEKTEELKASVLGTAHLTEAQADRLFTTTALQAMKKDPGPSAWLLVRKVGRFWLEVYENIPAGHKRTRDSLVLLVLGGWHWLLILFAALGIVKSRSVKPELAIVYATMLLLTLVYAVSLTVPRYRLPIMPLVCVLSAVGFAAIAFQRSGQGSQPR